MTDSCKPALQVERPIPIAPDETVDILTLDACTQGHFRREKILRDIGKAVTSFKAHQSVCSGEATISTGRWGCGIFGGLPSHKFVQQVLAASLAGVQLEFSMYGTPDGCDEV